MQDTSEQLITIFRDVELVNQMLILSDELHLLELLSVLFVEKYIHK